MNTTAGFEKKKKIEFFHKIKVARKKKIIKSCYLKIKVAGFEKKNEFFHKIKVAKVQKNSPVRRHISRLYIGVA